MFKHLRPVWAEVNLDNLAFNMKNIKKVVGDKEIIGVVKADAYGHGALDIAPVLIENGATRLAVAVLSEGIELRRAGIEVPIIILGFTPPTLISNIIKYDMEPTVYSYQIAKEISDIATKKNKTVKIHIAVDTGMGRIGFLPNEKSVEDVYKINKLPNIKIEGLFSHFSTADETDKEYSYEQLRRFKEFFKELERKGIAIPLKHIGNSAAIIDMEDSYFDAVRPGIIQYGYYPSKNVKKDNIELKPVMELKTNVVHVKTLEDEEYISYGRRYKTQGKEVIATLPVGYADGYTRFLFNKGKVIVKGQFAKVVGSICMDQCMIDVTHIKGVSVGDEVTLIGKSGGLEFTAEDIADLLGTISYEVTCMISRRVPRVYIKEGCVVKVRNYV